jgi:serine/threonine protein kinase
MIKGFIHLPRGRFTDFLSRGSCSVSAMNFYFACVVSVYKHIHQRDVLHRGLHLDTVMMDAQGCLVLTDWSFAKVRRAQAVMHALCNCVLFAGCRWMYIHAMWV